MRKKERIDYGAFCELYGKSLRNLVVEYLLENSRLDFAIGDMAVEIKISRPKAYELIKELEKENIVKKTREVSGTQLYMLDEKSKKAKLLIKDFKECLKIVVEENEEAKPRHVSSSGTGMAVVARNL